jgi:hypothetical protein
MTGVIVSGAPFLSPGPDVIIASVSALCTLLSGVATLLHSQTMRKTANRSGSQTIAKNRSKRPRLLTPEEFVIIEAHRRKRPSRQRPAMWGAVGRTLTAAFRP